MMSQQISAADITAAPLCTFARSASNDGRPCSSNTQIMPSIASELEPSLPSAAAAAGNVCVQSR
jgi:hypothetical protein